VNRDELTGAVELREATGIAAIHLDLGARV
jgi:hypothetical protein